MDQERFARRSYLPLVVNQGEIVGFADDLQIILRSVFRDFSEQLLELRSERFRRDRPRIRRHI